MPLSDMLQIPEPARFCAGLPAKTDCALNNVGKSVLTKDLLNSKTANNPSAALITEAVSMIGGEAQILNSNCAVNYPLTIKNRAAITSESPGPNVPESSRTGQENRFILFPGRVPQVDGLNSGHLEASTGKQFMPPGVVQITAPESVKQTVEPNTSGGQANLSAGIMGSQQRQTGLLLSTDNVSVEQVNPLLDEKSDKPNPVGRTLNLENAVTGNGSRANITTALFTAQAEEGQVDANSGLPRENVRGAHQVEEMQMSMLNQAATTAPRNAGNEQTPTARSAELPQHLQLAEAIRGQIGKDGEGRTHVRLQLQPESLGEVVIRLVYKDGNVSTHFHAATEGARQIIESSLGQLREALAGHQLNLQHSTVSAGGEEGRWGQDWNHGRKFDHPSRQNAAESESNMENDSAPGTVITQTGSPNSLNYFV